MPVPNPITILIAEDQAIIRIGIKYALEPYADLKVIAQSADGVTAILDALAFRPNVVLMDIDLPRINGLQAARQLKEALPNIRIIMLTSSVDDETIYAALGAGADGYCLKNVAPEHLHAAITAVANGVAWLDPAIADRVLRSLHKPGGLPTAESAKQTINPENLSENHMLVLQCLSKGEDLAEVSKKLSLDDDLMVKLVNDTIAKLTASVSGNKNDSSILPIEIPEKKILGERYSVESVIGLGGMGIVYKGRHLLMDRPVAIKMLHNEYTLDVLVTKRFLSEAKTLSSLSHPNLVAVFDFGLTPLDEPYMVMEYHEGKALDDMLEDQILFPTEEAISIFCQVCDAMTAVHQQNMVHRDIKPSNIIIAEDGLVKLVDFGIAQTIASKALNLTMSGEVVGTPKYMSPEQCRGEILDARSDIYSLGCVMYQVLTGQAPFAADSFYEMVQQHLETIPSKQPFEKLSSKISPDLQSIIFQTLEKEPSKRYPTAAALKKDLLSALEI